MIGLDFPRHHLPTWSPKAPPPLFSLTTLREACLLHRFVSMLLSPLLAWLLWLSLAWAPAPAQARGSPSASPTTTLPTPTTALAARDVPITTTLPPVSVLLLDLPNDGTMQFPSTSMLYYGKGFHTETSVYAVITGTSGVGDGPQTNYYYQGPSGIHLGHIALTADTGDQLVTGTFDLQCSRGTSYAGWKCQYGYETTQGTSMYTTFTTNIQKQTMITPIPGLLEQMRKSEATQGVTGTPSFSPASLAAAAKSHAVRSALFSPTMLFSLVAGAVMLGALAL
ncbi:hypothetical protein ACI68E_000272 [Malassezia pachydermatis]|uniref:Uncharacterized protein n=1 Tax=Malassezia pachydermatis TaxID=77020 RepID=A0A0N0RSI2_9BASI|nr:hypothetical protein Malapachy_2100 [Malassezia pachydermatis]KOS15353.1 hypothetical protein Malapachy_2100 [Malassezia pachydermatis]